MKAIRKYRTVRLVFVLLLLTLCRLSAQVRQDVLLRGAEKSQAVEAVTMSSDGKYVTCRLAYELNRDTLLVFNTAAKQKQQGFRTKVNEYFFIGANTLLLPSGTAAELWNLDTDQSTYFKDVVQAKALARTNQFVVHYGQSSNTLVLYDENGMPQQTLEHVERFFTLANGLVAAVTFQGEGNLAQLYLISAQEKRKVYATGLVIENVARGHSNSELFIFERDTAGGYQNLAYLDVENGVVHTLKDILPLDFNAAYLEKVTDENGYFLRLWSENKVDEGIVDIWYGNDTNLQEKYYPSGNEIAYLWHPAQGIIKEAGKRNLKNTVSLGNGKYFLGITPNLLNDYTIFNPDIEVNFRDIDKGDWKILGRFSPEIYVSANGQYLVSPKNGQWLLYNLKENEKIAIGNGKLAKPFFSDDGKAIIFDGDAGVWKYTIANRELHKMFDAAGCTARIINGHAEQLSYSGISKNIVNLQEPLLIQLSDTEKGTMALIRWFRGKETVLVKPSTNVYTEPNYDSDVRHLCYVEQNYNLPPQLRYTIEGKKDSILFKTNKQDSDVAVIKQETVTYPDGHGNPCKGILFYPENYAESETYPMVVHIYEKQSSRRNQYLNLSCHNTEGFNTRSLLKSGYFVFFPDIVYDSLGSGIAALQCVTHALDVLKAKKQINPKKIGLTGHSFGGYETNFIATHSNRFAAYVTGAGNSDIVSSYHSFNSNFLTPSFWRFESFQYRMYKSFAKDKQLYFNNNPIYNAEDVTAPMLLWTGMQDENIKWEETRSFYNALRRNNKMVIALFYRGQGHSLQNKEANQDLSIRTLDWFNYFLKDDHSIAWIKQEIKTGAE